MFFEVVDEWTPDRWHLEPPRHANGTDFDFWSLTTGERIGSNSFSDLEAPIQYEGRPLDVTMTAFEIPVVTSDLARLLTDRGVRGVQFVPVTITGQSGRRHGYQVMIVTELVKCFDWDASEYEVWTPKDGRPDKTGKVRVPGNWFINPQKVPPRIDALRVFEWDVPVIVSDRLRRLFAEAAVSGVTFESRVRTEE